MHNIFVPFGTPNTVKGLKRFLTTFGMTSFLCNFQICSFIVLIEKNEDKAKLERMEAEKLKKSYPSTVEYECEMELIDYADSVK